MGDTILAGKGVRKPQKALTARFVETVAEAGKYYDGEGLFLRVSPNGARRWVQRITIRGERRELGLGAPPAVSLAAARKLALENRGAAMMGRDPIQERRDARGALTFAEAAERFLAVKVKELGNEKHKLQWRSTLAKYAFPVLGPKRVSEISRQDVLRVLEPIWHDRTETATRLRSRIEAVLSWATVAGYRTGDNPAAWRGNLAAMLPAPERVAKTENHPAVALGDVQAWWRALAACEGMAARALEFAALTAVRSGEVRGMTWAELDGALAEGGGAATPATNATWIIPAARMKAGREHRVPLTAEALAILAALPRMEGSAHVFFAPRGGALSDMTLSAVMRRMQAAEVKGGRAGWLDPRSGRPAVPHGLRSTFSEWAAERGFDRDMTDFALAHKVGDETYRAYQRSDMLERRRAMMAAWAAFLGGEALAENVVRLGAAG